MALQLPQEAAFLAFPSIAWWAEIATMDVRGARTPQKHLASWLDLDVFQIWIVSVHIHMVSTFIPQKLYKVIH